MLAIPADAVFPSTMVQGMLSLWWAPHRVNHPNQKTEIRAVKWAQLQLVHDVTQKQNKSQLVMDERPFFWGFRKAQGRYRKCWEVRQPDRTSSQGCAEAPAGSNSVSPGSRAQVALLAACLLQGQVNTGLSPGKYTGFRSSCFPFNFPSIQEEVRFNKKKYP
jgi:hypothetical protein